MIEEYNDLEKNIANYVNDWRCIPMVQLATQRFTEGTEWRLAVDKLVEHGTIRRVKFAVAGQEIVLLMGTDAKFLGWC